MHKADYFLPVQEIRNVKATTIVQIQVLMHGLKKVGDAVPVAVAWSLCLCVVKNTIHSCNQLRKGK